MIRIVYFVAFVCVMLNVAGCDSLQTAITDSNSTLNQSAAAVNQVAGVVGSVAASPVAAIVPANISGLVLAICTVISVLYGAYQQMQKTLITKTTRAIVRGVQQAPVETQETVKPLIQSEMEAASILTQGKAIVAGLKNG